MQRFAKSLPIGRPSKCTKIFVLTKVKGVMDRQSRSALGLVRENLGADGRRLVVIAGDLRVTGEQDHHHNLEERIAELEARLNALTNE